MTERERRVNELKRVLGRYLEVKAELGRIGEQILATAPIALDVPSTIAEVRAAQRAIDQAEETEPSAAGVPHGDPLGPPCRACGSRQEEQEIDHHERVGAAIVHDCSRRQLVCVRCGNYDLTGAELAGYERRAAVAYFRSRPGAAPEPEAVKFARKACGCTRAIMAERLGISEARVMALESGEVSCSRIEELCIIAMLHAPAPRVTVEWPRER